MILDSILEIIDEAERLISANKPFEFWKLLEKSEDSVKSMERNIAGSVLENVVISGTVHLGQSSEILPGTVIEGNVYIGENCRIGPNAYLRNGTIIADNCHIGTSEIKNSIILSKSNVPHYSYVGDSVIGRNCNLGAGTKVANLRHDNGTVKV